MFLFFFLPIAYTEDVHPIAQDSISYIFIGQAITVSCILDEARKQRRIGNTTTTSITETTHTRAREGWENVMWIKMK